MSGLPARIGMVGNYVPIAKMSEKQNKNEWKNDFISCMHANILPSM